LNIKGLRTAGDTPAPEITGGPPELGSSSHRPDVAGLLHGEWPRPPLNQAPLLLGGQHLAPAADGSLRARPSRTEGESTRRIWIVAHQAPL